MTAHRPRKRVPRREGTLVLRRLVLLVVAGGALAALLGGLGRVGFRVPGADRAIDHGPLFVLGVFVTVIGLERAVALGRAWAYTAPVAGALGAVGTIAHLAPSPWLCVLASAALVLVNGGIVRRQSAAFTWLMFVGSLLLAGGAIGWALGRPVFEVVPAWLAFFVLTILAERLELSRLAPTSRSASTLLVALAGLFAVVSVCACLALPFAHQLLGVHLLALGVWQLRFDVSRYTVRRAGLPRYVAVGVLLGTGWLISAGLLLARFGLPPAGPHYDAILHAVLVGFVLSMVFAHGPIILPAVARIDVPFDVVLYAPLAVLHVGLLGRIVGDLAAQPELRRAGAAANGLALAVFLLAVLVARAKHRRSPNYPRVQRDLQN